MSTSRSKRHGRVAVLFSAHSVPARTVEPSEAPIEYHEMILANGPDSYADDCRETARLVGEELKDILSPDDWYFAFQSQGMSDGPWIGPTVEDTLSQLKAGGSLPDTRAAAEILRDEISAALEVFSASRLKCSTC